MSDDLSSGDSVEAELWNVFTFYTLSGNPLYPDLLKSSSFVRLCKDCNIIDDENVTGADVNVCYIAETRRRDRVTTKMQPLMTFNDFLNALMRLSVQLYEAPSVDASFEALLMENVLPFAKRRAPDAIDSHLRNPEVVKLQKYFQLSLYDLFSFYATSADQKRREDTSSVAKQRVVNTMKEALRYSDFLKFSMDFNLSNSVLLSTLELGDIYLSSVKVGNAGDNIRKLSFTEFWEALVRCALVAYSKISDQSVSDKVKGLLLYMWRSINDAVPKAMEERAISTYAGDLIQGAMHFNNRFVEMWRSEGYRDYLSPAGTEREEARSVLGRLLGKKSPTKGQRRSAKKITTYSKKKKRRTPGKGGSGASSSRGGGDASALSAAAASGAAAGGAQSSILEGVDADLAEKTLIDLLSRRPSIADMLERNLN